MESLAQNKMPTLLTMLGIVIGAGAVIGPTFRPNRRTGTAFVRLH